MKELLQRCRYALEDTSCNVLLADLDAVIAQQAEPVGHVVWGRDGFPKFTMIDQAFMRHLETVGNVPLYAATQPPAAGPVPASLTVEQNAYINGDLVATGRVPIGQNLWTQHPAPNAAEPALPTGVSYTLRPYAPAEPAPPEDLAIYDQIADRFTRDTDAPAEPVSAEGLPPMPAPTGGMWVDDSGATCEVHETFVDGYTASQMHAYALQCIAADRAARGVK